MIVAMAGRIALIMTLLSAVGLGACQGTPSSTCGAAGGRAHPEIGGQVLYYCHDWPRVNGGLYLLDVASGRVRPLTSDLAMNFDGAWSPDGARVAFQSTREGRDDIFVMDAAGGGVRRLTGGRGFNEYPSWSPDGQWITFNSSRDGVAGSRGTGYYRDLYLMRADGSSVRRLTRRSGSNIEAAWNPDGRTLAFQSDRAGTWNIYTMELDGGAVRQLTRFEKTGNAYFPRWSPDGSRIVFAAGTAGGPSSIYWLVPGQDDLHRVTAPHFDSFPDWSPDGQWIVFSRGFTPGLDGSQLFAVRPDGSGLTQLTAGPGEKDLPRWRPA